MSMGVEEMKSIGSSFKRYGELTYITSLATLTLPNSPWINGGCALKHHPEHRCSLRRKPGDLLEGMQLIAIQFTAFCGRN